MLTQKTEAINVKSLEVQALQDSRNPDQEASLWTKVCLGLSFGLSLLPSGG